MASHPVVFDYSGSLELARRLVALADQLDDAFLSRRGVFEIALAAWSGPSRDHVANALQHELVRGRQVEVSLRSEADAWARAWARAVDEHNQLMWRSAVDAAAAQGSPVPFESAPLPAQVPVAPAYLPTTQLVGVGGFVS